MNLIGNPSLTITPIYGIPDIDKHTALEEAILISIKNLDIDVIDNDILVLAQKIVSKNEDRYINYAKLTPSKEALEIASECGKDPQFVQLVLDESNAVIRVAPGILIVEHRSGFISANAGIDHSNIKGSTNPEEKWALLIPEDADESARKIRMAIAEITDKNIAVLIIDSHGRAWRQGTVGVSIGFSGLPALIDMRGKADLYGNILQSTIICAVDELAAGASLVMGQTNEAIPAVLVRGFPYLLSDGKFSNLLRSRESDLFR
ncbi:MAG: coenzyme F420-0:L-glutamate ligase [Anaerolineaceae bacterium]|nr:coenzyme F420-0:L-glutamate ligase [Anaerolineaceae bacterium]